MGPMGGTAVVSVITINILVLSSVLVVGFALGNIAARRDRQQDTGKQQGQGQVRSTRGSKRKARVRKSADNNKAKGAALKSPPSSGEQSHTEQLSRRTRNRKKKLAPKDLALDAFTRVARSHITCIGARDFESLLLFPRTLFIGNGRFVPYADCRDCLVTLGEARANTAGIDQLRILYVSCSWASAGGAQGDWTAKDFETTRAFLQRNPDLAYVYVGRSCVSSCSTGPLRAAQLRHVPLVLLRADVVLVLPPPTENNDGREELSPVTQHRHSDFRSQSCDAWSRMVLAVAAVGRAKVYVAFRAEPFPESVFEIKSGIRDVGETTRQAVDALRAAATAGAGAGATTAAPDGSDRTDEPAVKMGTEGDDASKSAAVVAMAAEAACKNWLGSDFNPLAALEEARAAVTVAEKSNDAGILESIRRMRPAPTPDFAEAARASLGEERVEGARELALSVLLFVVLCSQPKERARYTDAFVVDAGKMEISYRPIAVVRSPYRERFGTPRQPQVTASVLHGGAQEGEIVFLKGLGYEEALQDLSGFDMIWVISHMHLNKGWNRKVRPPRLPEERKGLFSTRSPHRPNAVALSSLRVDRVDADKGVIYVHGLDLLDGTPVLDVKPYIAYCDAFPDMKAGWLDALGSDHEAQEDFLTKFSVGATLVHTTSRSESVDGYPPGTVSGKSAEEACVESSEHAMSVL